MFYRIIFSEESRQHLREIRGFVYEESKSWRIATGYVKRLRVFCKELGISPHRGEHRIAAVGSFRTIGFERRVSVVFHIDESTRTVIIAGLFYAGRDMQQARNF